MNPPRLLLALVGLLLNSAAQAWSGHALCTWQALAPMKEIATQQVRAETLESFLRSEAPALERVLAEQEAWARATLDRYAPRPDALAFKAPAADDDDALRSAFLKALRLNVSSRLPLFLQLRPGEAQGSRSEMPWPEVTTLRSGQGARENRYVRLAPGQRVSALEVVATASSEPDYGLDLGLFADNDTVQGQQYGFGAQPFGNPAVDYSSQAPFHMAFHHEARIVLIAAGFLRRTHPEERVAMFSSLARHAFASGHDYWGWRFTGWAMHYVQDLTQPYHASVLPGLGVARMLGVNTLDAVGLGKAKQDAVALVTNRHVALEIYQFKRMVQAYEQARPEDALLAALRDTGQDAGYPRFEQGDLRRVVSREAFDAADAMDDQLELSMPEQYTSDPKTNLGAAPDDLDLYQVARAHSATEHQRLEALVVERLTRLGVYSRALVRALQTPR